MDNKFQALNDQKIAISLPDNMFKLEELTEYTLEAFQHEGLNHLGRKMWDKGRGRFPIDHPKLGRGAWFSEGFDCEILKPNSGFWQKGKLRIKVTYEFCLDDTLTQESSLDGLRVD